jgi:mannose-6-phosphate isomerase-like protein (cupin superfamily)
MSYNIPSRLAKFDELIPSKVPFVEGKLKGHQDRTNYSIIGPGVVEDAKQGVKIAEKHGFNIGAVSTAPNNGSGLHSHTTAEVFVVNSGSMRFYWGPDGRDGEVILNRGDVASFPTNVFRGFENVSDSEALMFVILGENDPGVITWTPKILKEAKDSGMVLLDDNSLIDLDKQNIPDGRKLIEPLQEKDLSKFDHYTLEDIKRFVIRYTDVSKYVVDDQHYNSNSIINYIDQFQIHEQQFEPHIPHQTGFGLALLRGIKALIHPYSLDCSEVYLCLDGEWEITCDEQKVVIGPRDIFSVPKNSLRSVRQVSEAEGNLYIIRQKN